MSFHNVDVTLLDLSDFSIYLILCVCVCVFHIYIYIYIYIYMYVENNFSIYSNSLY